MLIAYMGFFKFLFLLFIFVISGCVLRSDGLGDGNTMELIKNYGKIKKEYISINSWSVDDTQKSVQHVMQKIRNNKRFNEILKQKGVVKIKLGNFTDNTKEEGFPIEDVKNELFSEIGNDERFILIEKEDSASLLKEISYSQDGNVKKSDKKNIGNQYGADLLLFGQANVSKTMELMELTKNYVFTFKITEVETGERLLMDVYKMSKKYTVE